MKLFPPVNFGAVVDGIYRSGTPNPINYEFLVSLKLKSLVCLSRDVLSEDLKKFLSQNNINLILIENHDFGGGFVTVSEEMVVQAINSCIITANLPLLICCKSGKNLTGVVVACLRKLQRWSLVSILEEYRRFAGCKFQQSYEQFIELFDTEVVQIPENPPTFLS